MMMQRLGCSIGDSRYRLFISITVPGMRKVLFKAVDKRHRRHFQHPEKCAIVTSWVRG